MFRRKRRRKITRQWCSGLLMDCRWKKKEQRLMQMETKEEEWVSNKEEVYI